MDVLKFLVANKADPNAGCASSGLSPGAMARMQGNDAVVSHVLFVIRRQRSVTDFFSLGGFP